MENPQPENIRETIAWHALDHLEVCDLLQVSPEAGLTELEASQRRDQFGENRISQPRKTSWESGFVSELTNPLVVLLATASSVSLAIHRTLEGLVLLLVASLNILPSVINASRSGRRKSSSYIPTPRFARVRRNSTTRIIDPSGLVPGDVIQLIAGDIVPADARLIASANLRVEENRLTGEPLPADKVPQPLRKQDAALHERHNLVFWGTAVVHGRGEAVVIGTGQRTEIGKIIVQSQPAGTRKTPLRIRLEDLLNLIAAVLLGIFAVDLGIGSLHVENPAEILHSWSSISAALIPASLPAIVWIVSNRTRRRLQDQRVIVRDNKALETLGFVTTICTDQSGPLTEPVATVTIIDANGKPLQLHEPLRKGRPVILESEDQPERPWPPHSLLLALGSLASHASLQRLESMPGESLTAGDPAESAVVAAAAQIGLSKARLDRLYPNLLEAPYTPARKLQSSLHDVRLTPHVNPAELPLASLLAQKTPFFIVATGDPRSLLAACDRIWVNGHILPLNGERAAQCLASADQLVKSENRVIGIGFRTLDRLPAMIEDYPLFDNGSPFRVHELPFSPHDTLRDVEASYEFERNLIFVGIVGIQSPPRTDAVRAVMTCRKAGIRPILFTAGSRTDGAEIARRLRVSASREPHVLAGSELEHRYNIGLESAVEKTSIYTQVGPRQRLEIIRALQKLGHIVAVIGEEDSDDMILTAGDIGAAAVLDDRPFLRAPAGSLLLLDGSFSSLTSAIEEARRFCQKIRLFLQYSLPRSIGVAALLVVGMLSGWIPGLTPLQAIWLGLACDLILGLPFVLQAKPGQVMRGQGYFPGEPLISSGNRARLLWGALGYILISLGCFQAFPGDASPSYFLVQVLAIQLWYSVYLAYQASQEGFSWRSRDILYILIAALGLAAIFLLSVYWSPFASLMEMEKLSPAALLRSFLIGGLILPWSFIALIPRK